MRPEPSSSSHTSAVAAESPHGSRYHAQGSALRRQGALSVSTGVALYAISAATGSVGAWLLLTSFEATMEFGFEAFGVALASPVLALASLFVALAGFRSFDHSQDMVRSASSPALSKASVLFRLGFDLAILELLLIVAYEFPASRSRELTNGLSVLVLVVVTVAALVLLVSVALPLLRLGTGGRRAAGWVGFLLGLVGLSGEVAMSGLRIAAELNLNSSSSLNVMTFVQFPFMNVNVPFGAVVAASAALLSWSWWRYVS